MAEIIAKIIMSIFAIVLLPNWLGVIIAIVVMLFGKLDNSYDDNDMFNNNYDDDDNEKYSNPYYYNASTDLSDIIIYGFED